MAEKDRWDKIEIVTKFLATVVLASIPLVIKLGADSIAQSLERGRLIQSLISDLSQKDQKTKRDIALVALDAAIPPLNQCPLSWLRECRKDYASDQVINVASLLLRDITSDNWESQAKTAAGIIKRRSSATFYTQEIQSVTESFQRAAISRADASLADNTGQTTATATPAEVSKASQAAVIVSLQSPASAAQPQQNPALAGVKLVYIQYQSNKQQALAIQATLQQQGINAPGIEQINGIKQSDIRYASAAEAQAAQALSALIQQHNQLKIDKLVELSKKYQIAPGQFEIWLKD